MSTEQTIAGAPFPSGIERTLENARVLIEDRPWIDNPQKYRKPAEAILRRILTFDPGNEVAKALLAKAEQPLPQVGAVLPELVPPPLSLEPTPPRPLPREDSFVVQTKWTKPEESPTKSPVVGWIGFGVATVVAGFLIFGFL